MATHHTTGDMKPSHGQHFETTERSSSESPVDIEKKGYSTAPGNADYALSGVATRDGSDDKVTMKTWAVVAVCIAVIVLLLFQHR